VTNAIHIITDARLEMLVGGFTHEDQLRLHFSPDSSPIVFTGCKDTKKCVNGKIYLGELASFSQKYSYLCSRKNE
jgi:hypothetical protein